ncbi:hypothetical protein AB0K93_34950, partial [Streptomyces sp. NPDC052676]
LTCSGPPPRPSARPRRAPRPATDSGRSSGLTRTGTSPGPDPERRLPGPHVQRATAPALGQTPPRFPARD